MDSYAVPSQLSLVYLSLNSRLSKLLFSKAFFLLHVDVCFLIAEVITSAEFHPSHCNTLAYSSSKGSIRLIDLRQSALCDSHAKL